MSSSIPFLAGIKKMVTRTTTTVRNSSGASVTSSSSITTSHHMDDSQQQQDQSAFNKGITTIKTKVFDTLLAEFQEKEWRCGCGHVFRDSGDWQACEPSRCEAPSCPNPKFFLDGPGKNMLNKDGTVPLPQRVQALPASCKGNGPKGSCGSNRFK